MSSVNVEDLTPIGEFGSRIWCETVAEYGARLLREANLPSHLEWGFTENYTLPPSRLLEDGRQLSAYFIMVRDGSVSSGDGLSEECLSLPGFHVEIQWATICNQSKSLYGREGQRRRSEHEQAMFRQIAEYVGTPNPLGLKRGNRPAVWPKEIAAALSRGSEEGGGLHNIAARLQTPSPEFADLPTTDMGVPDFSAMSIDQRRSFLGLCGLSV
ncbi:MAG: hypothetical protein OXG24_06905 [Gammaproteobacteria bacterium]|nr:hypothetical protein [Gammaproteobacteria bacterium]